MVLWADCSAEQSSFGVSTAIFIRFQLGLQSSEDMAGLIPKVVHSDDCQLETQVGLMTL